MEKPFLPNTESVGERAHTHTGGLAVGTGMEMESPTANGHSQRQQSTATANGNGQRLGRATGVTASRTWLELEGGIVVDNDGPLCVRGK